MHLYEICCAERKRLTAVNGVIALEKRASLAAVGQANAGIRQYRYLHCIQGFLTFETVMAKPIRFLPAVA
jgi:hypothetical protein